VKSIFSIRGFSVRTGFTLVEIIVVIAIMAGLALLLAPTLKKAREKADEMKCASNLKQLCAAAHLYSIDNNGRLLPAVYLGNIWVSTLQNDLYLPPVTAAMSSLRGRYDPLTCPAYRPVTPPAGSIPLSQTTGINLWRAPCVIANTGVYSYYDADRGYISTHASQVSNPASTIYFADAQDSTFQKPNADVSAPDNIQNGIWYRHNGYANIVFFDGHVERRAATQVSEPGGPPGNFGYTPASPW